MSDNITITGLVVNDPRHIITSEGLSITNFRLASQQRRFDRSQERWIDGETNWYTVVSFRRLAINAAVSVKKGERVLVTGKLRIREWENSEKAGITAEIEAEAIGHDFAWGTANFARSVASSPTKETFPSEADSANADHDAGLVDHASAEEHRDVSSDSASAQPENNPGEREPVAASALPF